MANDKREGAEEHPLNIETTIDLDSWQDSFNPLSCEDTEDNSGTPKVIVKERTKSGTVEQLISGILCINILFLGCAIVTASAFKAVTITAVHRQIFLIILFILTMSWMLFYIVCTYRKNRSLHSKDGDAAPVWIKVGLVLFGVLSLLMDVFQICTSVGYLHCDSAVKVVFPIVQAVFLFVQTYFFIFHARDCVQLQTTISRVKSGPVKLNPKLKFWQELKKDIQMFLNSSEWISNVCGLSVTLATNLMVWVSAVTQESILHTEVPETINMSISYLKYMASLTSDKECECHLSGCPIVKEAYNFLCPFNIEYSIIAAAITYVMWTNVGRIPNTHSHRSVKFNMKDVYVGPVLGILVVVAGLVTFVLFEVDMEKSIEERKAALFVHFIMNIVIVSLMFVFTIIGSVIYRLDPRESVSQENPAKSLDVGLLLGCSMGQFFTSYFSIVAVVATGAAGILNNLYLAWNILMVLQISLQNYFIIKGLDRDDHKAMPQANAHTIQGHAETNDDEDNCTNSSLGSSLRKHWKIRVLKEIFAFLSLANIILWIMPAFGARPQYHQDNEIKFYSFAMWASIVNIGLPFAIFYRMHSFVRLLELYLIA